MKFTYLVKVDKNGITTNHFHIFKRTNDLKSKLFAITYNENNAKIITKLLNKEYGDIQ